MLRNVTFVAIKRLIDACQRCRDGRASHTLEIGVQPETPPLQLDVESVVDLWKRGIKLIGAVVGVDPAIAVQIDVFHVSGLYIASVGRDRKSRT